MTAHWIEEPNPRDWSLQSALIGFVRMNQSHNGKRLGQALFKGAQRVGISDRVSLEIYIYCNDYRHSDTPLDSHGDMRQREFEFDDDGGTRCHDEEASSRG